MPLYHSRVGHAAGSVKRGLPALPLLKREVNTKGKLVPLPAPVLIIAGIAGCSDWGGGTEFRRELI
jgi:hypothetical protein